MAAQGEKYRVSGAKGPHVPLIKQLRQGTSSSDDLPGRLPRASRIAPQGNSRRQTGALIVVEFKLYKRRIR